MFANGCICILYNHLLPFASFFFFFCQIISQAINVLCKLSVVTQTLELSVSLVSPRISLSAETRIMETFVCSHM